MSWTLETLLLELNPGSRTFLSVTGKGTLLCLIFPSCKWASYWYPALRVMGTSGKTNKQTNKKSACQCRRQKRHRFDSWVRKIPWIREWQPTPVFLPREPHG